MEKFKEKRIVKILDIINMVFAISFLLSLIIAIFYTPFLFSIIILPVAIIPVVLSSIISNKKDYTISFLEYITDKTRKAKSLEELKLILIEFKSLAIEDNIYSLSFPDRLRIVHQDIISKIEILEILN